MEKISMMKKINEEDTKKINEEDAKKMHTGTDKTQNFH